MSSRSVIQEVLKQAGSIILDKDNEIKVIVSALLARGHVLIEDVPGVGKTTIVQTIAKLFGLKVSRVQMTNDLMPSDIVGYNYFDRNTAEFIFREGPIFTNLLLADELNRASPRTQSALLQAMEEGEVTVEGKNYQLHTPFLVLATQNPSSHVGTNLLPESQLDRFMVALKLNYASAASEILIFSGFDAREKLATLVPVVDPGFFAEAQDQVSSVHISQSISEYVSRLVTKSRIDDAASAALSTRAGMALIKAARAFAFLEGHEFIKPEVIKFLVPYVFGHRLRQGQSLDHGVKAAQEIAAATEVVQL